MKYYKIYHYSSIANLSSIDPAFYGTGVTQGSECKRGKTGVNKTYFYTKDEPETCVRSPNRYEIYLPYKWRPLIYDRGEDPLNLYAAVKAELRQQFKREPYAYEMKDYVEERIQALGFKGWRNSLSQLPHVIILFYKLTTEKPKDLSIVYDWENNILENKKLNLTPYTNAKQLLFFQNDKTGLEETFKIEPQLNVSPIS